MLRNSDSRAYDIGDVFFYRDEHPLWDTFLQLPPAAAYALLRGELSSSYDELVLVLSRDSRGKALIDRVRQADDNELENMFPNKFGIVLNNDAAIYKHDHQWWLLRRKK